jgi:hypothetical protein
MGAVVAVDLRNVRDASPADAADADLLVVGGPTHAHGMSRPGTRRNTNVSTRPVREGFAPEVGLREWLQAIARPSGPVAAAAFDTRFARARWLTGSAAVGAHGRLSRLGYRMVEGPRSFFVKDAGGPLTEGQLEEAVAWGERLGAACAPEAERRVS